MRDTDLFARLLSLQRPWGVERVELDDGNKRVDIWLRHRSNARFRCPKCGSVLPLYDHTPLRRWRHLDHGSWMTWLHARIPRVSCLFHGIRQVRVPWALPNSRLSTAFEKHAIDTLLEADVLGASRLLRLSWDEAWGVMERAVARGLKAKRRRVIRHVGVDEKAIAKRHQYVTLVSDLDRGTVEFVAFDRKMSSLDAFYQSLTPKQLAGIEAVVMDMWEPYIAATMRHVPHAATKIVFDRFHVMKHMTKAVDDVRKAEHRQLQKQGDDSLKRSKYLWLFSEENLPTNYAEWFARLKGLNLRTGRAWAIKESLRVLWTYQRKHSAKEYWREWYFWATHSKLRPVIKVARMIHGHLANVLSYCDFFLTNATNEGLNSKIQTVKKTPTDFATAST